MPDGVPGAPPVPTRGMAGGSFGYGPHAIEGSHAGLIDVATLFRSRYGRDRERANCQAETAQTLVRCAPPSWRTIPPKRIRSDPMTG